MLYVQLKSRAILEPGKQLLIRDVADAWDSEGGDAMGLCLPCPETPGVWKLPAMAVVRAAESRFPQITMMGENECFVHIVPKDKRNRTHLLRAAFAFLVLFLGSTLALTWFHADVNMQDAQRTLYRLITGDEVRNMWYITVPYALGVGLGVALFYALIGKKDNISPLDIKLDEYRKTAEQSAGKTP